MQKTARTAGEGSTRFRRIAIIVTVLGLLVAGCGGNGSDTEGANTASPEATGEVSSPNQASGDECEEASLTIALSSMSIGQALNFVTLDGGFFENYNLDVELLNSGSGSAATQAVISGDADFASSNVDTVLNAVAQDQELYTPLRLLSGQPGSLVVTKEFADQAGVAQDAPIDERLAALDGATVASPSPNSTYTVLVQRAVDSAGASVEFTYLDSQTMPAVLSQGQVDAFIASSPYTDQVVVEGQGVLWVNGHEGEWPGTSKLDFIVPLATPGETVENNPDRVVCTMAAYLEASQFIQEQPEEARQVIKDRFPDLGEDLFASIWETNRGSYSNPIPEPEAIARVQEGASGEFAEEIKQIDPESVLLPELVDRAVEMSGYEGE